MYAPTLTIEILEDRVTPDGCDCPGTLPPNEPPEAADDRFPVIPPGTMTLDVLANDSDPDGDQVFITGVTQPSSGVVTVAPDLLRLEYQPPIGFTGVDSFEYTAADGFGGEAIGVVTLVTAKPVDQLVNQYAVGSGPGTPSPVSVFNADGSEAFSSEPFPGFTGGVRVAVADVNGDEVPDLIAGTGPGVVTEVRVIDGADRVTELFSVQPFEDGFTGGVYVAAGDVNGDGTPDIAISPDEGGGPRVRLYSGADFSQLNDFFGIEDSSFRGGARVAFGDLNADATADLLVAAGFGGGPRVAGFNGRSLAAGATTPDKLFPDFFVFEQTLRNGVFIAAGDLNADGFADVIAGGGPGGGPRVFALSGQALASTGEPDQVQVANFFAGDTANRGGIRIVAKDLDGDARADLVTGDGTDAGSRVTGYAGVAIPSNDTPDAQLFGFDAFPGFTAGVFVG